MNYCVEEKHPKDILCYWESHRMGSRTEYIYPSLPEPFISIYFSLNPSFDTLIKGISWKADYLKMHSQLFGVTMKLKGFLHLNLIKSFEISNQLIPFKNIGGNDEIALINKISIADTFEDRISIFKKYYEIKKQLPLSKHQYNFIDADNHLLHSYEHSNIISKYADKMSLTTRTINRWFVKDIGVSPKKLSKVMRFNKTLIAILSYKEDGFYLDYGYFDQAHFIKEFKEFIGQSPENYLKMVSDLYNE